MINVVNIVQLSPEWEVNSGRYIPRREASRYMYPPLFTDHEGNSCFSIYEIRWIKKCQVTGASQKARKLLSADLVNTKQDYH